MLYQAVLDPPDDAAPRLAYADWLEANGDPDRARFTRVSCRLEWTSPADPEWVRLLHESNGLLQGRRPRWLFGRPDSPRVYWEFLRGFPEAVHFANVR